MGIQRRETQQIAQEEARTPSLFILRERPRCCGFKLTDDGRGTLFRVEKINRPELHEEWVRLFKEWQAIFAFDHIVEGNQRSLETCELQSVPRVQRSPTLPPRDRTPRDAQNLAEALLGERFLWIR